MKRLHKQLLIERYGRIWYEGQLFTGVMFEPNNGDRLLALNVLDGLPVSIYQPICAPDIKIDIALDMSSKWFDEMHEYGSDGPVFFDGNHFKGAAYYFMNGICLEERVFRSDGLVDCKANWSEDGTIESYETQFDESNQGSLYVEWHVRYQAKPPFRLKGFSIYRTVNNIMDAVSGQIDFSTDGSLINLGSNGGFLVNYATISREAPFNPLKDILDIFTLKASPTEQFSLKAVSDIDDQMLEKLVHSGMFLPCPILRLTKCHLDSLLIFSNPMHTPNLKELIIFEDRTYSKEIEEQKKVAFNNQKCLRLAQELKQARPSLRILFDSMEIV